MSYTTSSLYRLYESYGIPHYFNQGQASADALRGVSIAKHSMA